jgi:hypothetical protein
MWTCGETLVPWLWLACCFGFHRRRSQKKVAQQAFGAVTLAELTSIIKGLFGVNRLPSPYGLLACVVDREPADLANDAIIAANAVATLSEGRLQRTTQPPTMIRGL